MGNTNNVYSGPIATLTIGGNSIGYIGDGTNVEIVFEPVQQAFNSGDMFQMYGMGRFTVEIAETDSTTLGYLNAATGSETAVVATDLKGNTYTIADCLVSYQATRGFGETAHTYIVTGQKKVAGESNWVAIS